MMHRWLIGLTVALTAPMAVPALAQENVPQIPFDSVPNFLKFPADIHLGEATGVAVNSKGHVFVYSRSGSSVGPAYGNAASQLLEFHDGRFQRALRFGGFRLLDHRIHDVGLPPGRHFAPQKIPHARQIRLRRIDIIIL